MTDYLKINAYKIIKVIVILACLTSFLVIIGWLFDIKIVLNILAKGATMKFNTALCFLFLSIGTGFTFSEYDSRKVLNKLFAFPILFIGFFSLLEYSIGLTSIIDTLFVEDLYSKSFPGRMSPATAFCFILLGISLWSIQTNKVLHQKFIQQLLLLVAIISLVSIVAYILQIPAKNRVFFINSMAIHTSVLFLLLSFTLSMKNAKLGFSGLLFGKYAGSKLIRKLLPFTIILPLVLSYILLLLLSNNQINNDFGVVLYSVLFILLSIIYISIIAVGLNKSDEKWKGLENSLRTTNQELEYFRQALDKSSIIAFTDEKGIVIEVNDKFCEISQYSRDEIIGNTHRMINSGYHAKSFFQKLWKTIKAGEVWIGDIKNKAKDGSYYWVHTSIIPFKDETGKIYRYLAIRQDVTKRKLAEEMLASQYVKKLEQKNKELEQFAYIASHDLQEPLRTVTNFALALTEDYGEQLDENANKYLDSMNNATERMRTLIRCLLDYSRLGRERKLSFVDCTKIVQDAAADLSNAINETDAQIVIDKMPKLNVFETEMRQLFQNLISNAIKFRRKELQPQIKIASQKLENKWEFSVSDNGIGIDAKYFDRIFQIFQRLHGKNQYAGYGIGLSNCKKIVELHGGEIWVNSVVGIGTTFTFTISNL